LLKTKQLGIYTLKLVKAYDDFIIMEGSTSLMLRKAPNLKKALEKLEQEQAIVVKAKLAELIELSNLYKRRCYEFA
jgi:hypothetical protein